MGGKSTLSTTEPLLGTLRVQTSMYGLAVPLMWGQPRVPGNLLWFGNFVATAHTTTTTQGGKGGGGVTQVDTKYTYTAAAVLALGRGVVHDIASAWVGKKRYGGETIAEHTVSRSHTDVVPPGLTVTVALDGGTFSATASVSKLATGNYAGDGATDTYPYQEGLAQGVHWTRSGLVYTFAADLEGETVTINWLELLPESRLSALDQLGLSLAKGLTGQPVWGWLATYNPAQALAYSGTAYLYASDYPLTNQAEVENHTFEVVTASQVGGGVVDAWPHLVLRDFLLSPLYGAGWQSGRLSDLATFQAYVQARELWFSPSMLEQRPARDWLEALAQICNAEWVWQGGVLDLVPRGDEAISSSYATFTPNTTPVFDLVHGEGGDILDAVEVEPVVNEDAHNIVRIEWTNRANDYTIEVMEARDAAHIEQFGERPADVVQMHAIHTAAVAQSVCQQLLQREMTVWNKYRFKTSWARCVMGLMDLATLTDEDSALDRVPVRITSRAEAGGNTRYEWEAEDAPIGSASAPLYGAQAGSGFSHDYNTTPGNVTTPVFFEAPVERTVTGLEVYAAFSGTEEYWGGARVWASLDGDTYREVGIVYGGARYGTLTASLSDVATSAAVQLVGQGGQMLPGTATDAAQLATLCWVQGSEDSGEYIAHEDATLTGADAYTLSGLVRGAFGTTAQASASGAKFVRVDDAVGRSGPLDLSLIGETIWFKFTSFNVYSRAEQALADVSAYTYTITGAMAELPPPAFDEFSVRVQPDGTREIHFAYTTTPKPADWLGAEVRYIGGFVATPAWEDMTPLNVDQTHYTVSPAETNQLLAGEYTFAGRSLDRTGAASALVYDQIELPARRLGDVAAEYDDSFEAWPGTLTDCNVNENNVIEADDSGTWDGLTTWDAWTHWITDPADPIVYTGPVRDLTAVLTGLLDATLTATGTVTVELRSSATSDDPVADPGDWSAWGDPSAQFTARYFQLRLTVDATVPEPVPTISALSYRVSAPLKREYINDVDISALTGSYRIGTGDIRVPLANTYSTLLRLGVVIQDSSAGTWSWQRIDNVLTYGPRVQFKLNGTLADPDLVDFYPEGF